MTSSSTRHFRPTIHFFLFTCLLLNGFMVTQAQIKKSTDGLTPKGIEAGAPAGSYSMSEWENVNLFNGQVSFTLPITQQGRGESGSSLPIRINRQPWIVKHQRLETGGSLLDVFNAEGSWWNPALNRPVISGGSLVGKYVGANIQDCYSDGTYYFMRTNAQLTFTAPDGTEFNLIDREKGGFPRQDNCTFSESGYRGSVFITPDGTSATFYATSPIQDISYASDPYWSYANQNFYPSGYLMLRNGTRYEVVNGAVTRTRDRNGNETTFQSISGGTGLLITDSLQRQIVINYDVNDGYPYGLCDRLTLKGFGGVDRILRISYDFNGNRLRTTQPGDPTSPWTISQMFPQLDNYGEPGGPKSVAAIWLPDGRSYKFKYNVYSELARVELPTGGAIEYDWTGGEPNGTASGVIGDYLVSRYPANANSVPLIGVYRRLIERRVYTTSDISSLEGKTTYSKPATISNGGNLTSEMLVEQWTPTGNTCVGRSKHYFHGSAYQSQLNNLYDSVGPQWLLEGREYRTETMNTTSQIALRQIEHIWSNGSFIPNNNYGFPVPINPRITETKTTLVEGNLVAKQTFTYSNDEYNNLTDGYEYNYGSGAHGTLLRRTHTEYLTTNNGYNYATDTNIHLRSLPNLIQVFDAGNVKKSETTVEYDVYSGTNHAALVDRAGIVGLDATYNTGKTTRGNVTGVTQWLDNPAGSLSGYSQYDIAGNVVKSIDPKGKSDTVGYTDNFSVAANNIGTFAFATSMSTPIPDTAGTYASNTALSVSTKYDYDSGKAVSFTDANNQITTMDYTGDALDRPKQVNKPDGGITTFAYGDGVGFGNLYVRTQNKLNATEWTDSYVYFDGLGRTKQTKSFEGGTTWTFSDMNYDALGRAYQVSNPYRITPTDWTTTTFDSLGRVTAVTSPDNAVVSTAYHSNQVVVTDQAGKKRMSETDAFGRLLKVWEITPTDAQTIAVSFPGQSFNAGYLTTYSYDTLDNLMTVNQATQTRSFVYDSLKRLKSATNPESGTTTYSYDNNSNLYQKTDALGLTATYTYDNLNRNTTIGYSSYTNGTAFVDIHYDSAPLGKGRFHYNSKYNTESNGTLAYNYDFINSYDAAGRPTSKSQNFLVNQGGWTQKAFTTTATYDLAGNVLSQTYPSGRTVNYSYDVAARQTSVSGKLGGITGAGNTDLNYATDLKYTAAGLLAKETYGTTTALYRRNNYNVRQQLYAVRVGTEGATTYDNDPMGSYYNQATAWDRGILNWHYGNNDFAAWGTSGTNNNGNVLRAHSWIPGAGVYVDDYEYDALNRITKDTGNYNATYVQAFDYDRFGNRTINQALTTNVDINKKLFSVNATNNRLGVPSGQTGAMNYDAVGNLIFDSYTNPGKIDAMTYDAENHMTSAANGGHQYRYNAEGKRVKRIIAGANGGEFWMVYGIGGELVAEYNATSGIPLQTSPNKEYGYRSGQMLVVWDDTETTANQKLKWLVTDQLGSTRMEIGRDGAANSVVRHDYLPFGEELGGTKRSGNGFGGVTKTKQKFTSKQRDDETGLDFFEARHYSSIQGRFTTPDEFNGGPVEVFTQAASSNPTFYADLTNPQSLNKYQYTFNNPLRYTDPDGHCPQCWQQIINSPAGQQIAAAAGVAASAAILASTDAGTQLKNAVKEAARQAGKAADVAIEYLGTPGMRPCDACFGNDPIMNKSAEQGSNNQGAKGNQGNAANGNNNGDNNGQKKKPMIGENGTQTTSTTVKEGKGWRVDVENPNPGQRPGQIHYQSGKTKYLYDSNSGTFVGASKTENKRLLADPQIQNAIQKGKKILGES